MEIQQLRAFVAVAREGSVTRAAQKVFRTQPAVSMAVKKLERELGIALLRRAGRGVQLTQAGGMLYRKVEPLLGELEEAFRRVREASDGRLLGPVRVGADDEAVAYLLPRTLRAFRKSYADVELQLAQQEGAQTIEMMTSGRLDLGLLRVDSVPARLTLAPVLESPTVVISTKALNLPACAELSVEVLAELPLVLRRSGCHLRERIELALAQRGLTPSVALETDSWETVKRYVGLGHGVAAVPAIAMQQADRRLSACAAGHIFGHDQWSVVTRKDAELNQAAQRLIGEISKLEGPRVG